MLRASNTQDIGVVIIYEDILGAVEEIIAKRKLTVKPSGCSLSLAL